MKNVYITDTNCITPLGFDLETNWNSLLEGKSGIEHYQNKANIESFYASIINDEKLNQSFSLISENQSFTKLEKMMILALTPLISRNTINNRTAIIFSTTKGNIGLLENKNVSIESAYLSVLAKKVSRFFNFITEPVVVSNACISGILAVSVAKKIIQSGLYDDAFIVAGDEISEFVLSGFNSFQAMSDAPCKPYDAHRNGVTLGEASAAAYITSDTSKVKKGNFKIIGDGSINDANHISGPSRTGEGLFRSIESCFKESNLPKDKVDYISAHGTATIYNDEMESIAFSRASLENVPLNSLKGFYGHTLGTSGLLETVIAIVSAQKNKLIASKGFSEMGVSMPINILSENINREVNYFLKTASGFGGCNAAVLFEKVK